MKKNSWGKKGQALLDESQNWMGILVSASFMEFWKYCSPKFSPIPNFSDFP